MTVIILSSCATKNQSTKNIKSSHKIDLEEIFNRKFQQMFISRGDNFSDFSVRKDYRNLFLVALHNEIPIKDFKSRVQFSNSKMDSIINILETKSWLHKIDGKYKPTVFVATKEDGNQLYEYAKPISRQIAKEIKKELPTIKKEFQKTEISKKQNFEEWSFLILSDVLLDNWQIFNVENQFLGKFARPIRHGKNYYASIEEITTDRESFGIYGNQYGKISVYGNNREKADLSRTEYFVSNNDNQIFKSIAENFLPKLVEVLNKNKEYAKNTYTKSGYSKEITFEEFFMWWYHFIYTQATDDMAEMKILTIPKSGNFVYEIEE